MSLSPLDQLYIRQAELKLKIKKASIASVAKLALTAELKGVRYAIDLLN